MNTNNPVKIYVGDDVQKRISKNINTYEDILSQLIKGKTHMCINKELIKLLTNDTLRLIVEKKTEDSVDLIIRNVLIKTIHDLEKTTAYGSFFALLFFINIYKSHMRDGSVSKIICVDKDAILKVAACCSRSSTKKELRKLLNIFCDSDLVCTMINTTFDMIGADGQIFIDDKVANENIVELIEGHRFYIYPESTFQSSVNLNRWEREDAKCIVIDGIIERVSEIEAILAKLAETKEPTFFVCRGYSNDVISTLATNYNRNILDVIPLVVPYDLLGINLINDVAVVCNTDLISSLKGQLISTLTVDDFVNVDHVIIDAKKSLIKCEGSSKRVRQQIIRLLNEREKNLVIDKNTIIDQRLSCLSAKCIRIRFGKTNINKLGIMIDRTERAILLLQEVCKFGHINTNLLYEMIDMSKLNSFRPGIQKTLSDLQKHGYNMLPARSIIAAIRASISLFELLNKTGAIIVDDK